MANLICRARNASEMLPNLLEALLDSPEVGSRVAPMKEITFAALTLTKPTERYITTPLRKVSLPAQIAETMWVLSGRDDVDWLSNYLPRAAEFSDDGRTWRGAYGPRLRNWHGQDPLKYVVGLLSEDAETRRAAINIFDSAVDLVESKDIPCNNWLHFLSRDGKLNLHVAIRSNDVFWGWSGINAFEWSALLEIVASILDMEVGELHFSTSSLHLYEHHWERAQSIVDAAEDARQKSLPVSSAGSAAKYLGCSAEERFSDFEDQMKKWFVAENLARDVMASDDTVLAAVDLISDPMLRQWAAVVALHWRPAATHLKNLLPPEQGITEAFSRSPRRKASGVLHERTGTTNMFTDFAEFVADLHAAKDAVYGQSWKKRGEQIGIMANIARKIDRLGEAGGGDTSADTVMDLLVYLIKYRMWIVENCGGGVAAAIRADENGLYSDDPENVAIYLRWLTTIDYSLVTSERAAAAVIDLLKSEFDDLEATVNGNPRTVGGSRERIVSYMILQTFPVAFYFHQKEIREREKPTHVEPDTRRWNPEA